MSTEISKLLKEVTHLALKNFCPNVPFGFLHRPIMYTCVPELHWFGANTKNLANGCLIPTDNFECLDNTCISCSPMVLVLWFLKMRRPGTPWSYFLCSVYHIL